jgi:hypothetical protein
MAFLEAAIIADARRCGFPGFRYCTQTAEKPGFRRGAGAPFFVHKVHFHAGNFYIQVKENGVRKGKRGKTLFWPTRPGYSNVSNLKYFIP